MNCREAEQYIQPFINDELTDSCLTDFLDHIENCVKCHDEMETSYLLKEAFGRLEEAGAFNLDEELRDKISTMRRCAYIHELLSIFRRIIQLMAGITLAVLLLAFYLRFL